MNRTIKNSRVKLTILFVTSLFVLTFLIQSTAYGQPPVVRPPRVLPKATPVTINPNLPITNNVLPDLQITDIQMADEHRCQIRVQVTNTGLTDAGSFDVWLDLRGNKRSEKVAKTIGRLESKKDAWVTFEIRHDFNGNPWPGAQFCPLDWGQNTYTAYAYDLWEFHAVADPKYLKNTEPQEPGKQLLRMGGLITSGSPVRNKTENGTPVALSEPRVREADENNNELIVRRNDVKLYTAPPPIRIPK